MCLVVFALSAQLVMRRRGNEFVASLVSDAEQGRILSWRCVCRIVHAWCMCAVLMLFLYLAVDPPCCDRNRVRLLVAQSDEPWRKCGFVSTVGCVKKKVICM